MFFIVRMILFAIIFLSFHYLLDGVPASKAKEKSQETLMIFKFPDVEERHATSTLQFRSSCIVIQDDTDAKRAFSYKVQCLELPIRSARLTGRIRRRKKRKLEEDTEKNDIGDREESFIQYIREAWIFGERFQTALYVICWSILYTTIILILKKIVSVVKHWITDKTNSRDNTAIKHKRVRSTRMLSRKQHEDFHVTMENRSNSCKDYDGMSTYSGQTYAFNKGKQIRNMSTQTDHPKGILVMAQQAEEFKTKAKVDNEDFFYGGRGKDNQDRETLLPSATVVSSKNDYPINDAIGGKLHSLRDKQDCHEDNDVQGSVCFSDTLLCEKQSISAASKGPLMDNVTQKKTVLLSPAVAFHDDKKLSKQHDGGSLRVDVKSKQSHSCQRNKSIPANKNSLDTATTLNDDGGSGNKTPFTGENILIAKRTSDEVGFSSSGAANVSGNNQVEIMECQPWGNPFITSDHEVNKPMLLASGTNLSGNACRKEQHKGYVGESRYGGSLEDKALASCSAKGSDGVLLKTFEPQAPCTHECAIEHFMIPSLITENLCSKKATVKREENESSVTRKAIDEIGAIGDINDGNKSEISCNNFIEPQPLLAECYQHSAVCNGVALTDSSGNDTAIHSNTSTEFSSDLTVMNSSVSMSEDRMAVTVVNDANNLRRGITKKTECEPSPYKDAVNETIDKVVLPAHKQATSVFHMATEHNLQEEKELNSINLDEKGYTTSYCENVDSTGLRCELGEAVPIDDNSKRNLTGKDASTQSPHNSLVKDEAVNNPLDVKLKFDDCGPRGSERNVQGELLSDDPPTPKLVSFVSVTDEISNTEQVYSCLGAQWKDIAAGTGEGSDRGQKKQEEVKLVDEIYLKDKWDSFEFHDDYGIKRRPEVRMSDKCYEKHREIYGGRLEESVSSSRIINANVYNINEVKCVDLSTTIQEYKENKTNREEISKSDDNSLTQEKIGSEELCISEKESGGEEILRSDGEHWNKQTLGEKMVEQSKKVFTGSTGSGDDELLKDAKLRGSVEVITSKQLKAGAHCGDQQEWLTEAFDKLNDSESIAYEDAENCAEDNGNSLFDSDGSQGDENKSDLSQENSDMEISIPEYHDGQGQHQCFVDGAANNSDEEFDESGNTDLLEMFFGEILANYDPHQLMDSFQEYEKIREEMNTSIPGDGSSVSMNNTDVQSNENDTGIKAATDQNKGKNTDVRGATPFKPEDEGLRLTVDMPSLFGGINTRRVDHLKAMKFWYSTSR